MLTKRKGQLAWSRQCLKLADCLVLKWKKKPNCKHQTSTALQNDFTKKRNAVAKEGQCFYSWI